MEQDNLFYDGKIRRYLEIATTVSSQTRHLLSDLIIGISSFANIMISIAQRLSIAKVQLQRQDN
jgi:hypothetical protein